MVKSASSSLADTTAKKATRQAAKKTAGRAAAKSPKTTAKPVTAKPVAEKHAFQITELVKIWYNGWKQTFNLSGRSSRFELWTFLLFNAVLMAIIQLKCTYFMSERFLLAAANANYEINQIENYITTASIIFYLSFIIPLIPTGAMLIRRMHDINKLAWKNYMEPIFMGFVVLCMLFIALTELENTDYVYIALLLSVCFITILYSVGFYGLKVLIMTFFYRGNEKENEYGSAQYNDDAHEEYALNLSCLCLLFVGTIALLYLTLALI